MTFSFHAENSGIAEGGPFDPTLSIKLKTFFAEYSATHNINNGMVTVIIEENVEVEPHGEWIKANQSEIAKEVKQIVDDHQEQSD